MRVKNVARGLVPRWGRGGAPQNPPRQFAVPSHNSNSGFSYLGVPAPTGMSDCYGSMSRTTIRDRPPPLISSLVRKCPYAASSVPECHRTRTRRSGSPIRHSREGGNPRTNIPRKNVNRDTTTYVYTATPLRLSGESTPEPRYGAGIQRGVGGSNFHTLVCRRQPGWAIGTKMTLRGPETARMPRPSNQLRCRLSTGESCRVLDRWSIAE